MELLYHVRTVLVNEDIFRFLSHVDSMREM